MQFPDDVLGIIRAYTHPQMKYVNEFRAGLRKINPYMHGITYLQYDVKRKLFTNDANLVIDCWTKFTDSIEYTNQVRYTPYNSLDPFRSQELKKRIEVQNKNEEDLRLLIYGEKRWR